MSIPTAIACVLAGFVWGLLTEQWLTRRGFYNKKVKSTNTPAPNNAEDERYRYKLIWGVDRRAQGPLEMREDKHTLQVEWRYNSHVWRSDNLPPEIASLFDQEMLS